MAFKKNSHIKILFFIGSLRTGGKERRMIELISYLKDQNEKYELLVVINYESSTYPSYMKLNIPYKVLRKRRNYKDPKLFFQFYKICQKFNPNIIHAWGGMQAFYAIPASVFKRIPLVNSQITNAPPEIKKFSFVNLINQINFRFSKVILSNSLAGLHAYNPPCNKKQLIYSGVNLDRFINLPQIEIVKNKYRIRTQYAVVMVASFSSKKKFELFYEVANYTTRLRPDVTFIGAGGPADDGVKFERLRNLAIGNPNIIFPGHIYDVEYLVSACDIGMLLTHGESFPNAVLEYMALGKPVIANETGGTKELVRHNENGFLLNNESVEEIAEIIMVLIDNPEKRKIFGIRGREIIAEYFSLDKMGKSFENVYNALIF
jgi:glycosyltransferase involved in cell wall biosynthesis